jgi:hypothetical protein
MSNTPIGLIFNFRPEVYIVKEADKKRFKSEKDVSLCPELRIVW